MPTLRSTPTWTRLGATSMALRGLPVPPPPLEEPPGSLPVPQPHLAVRQAYPQITALVVHLDARVPDGGLHEAERRRRAAGKALLPDAAVRLGEGAGEAAAVVVAKELLARVEGPGLVEREAGRARGLQLHAVPVEAHGHPAARVVD